ncbi:MAG: tellurite resistance TerB family protein [Silicimonas sp.]|nr:tellurite resistance TerB family protein [Silicimonas sp.]
MALQTSEFTPEDTLVAVMITVTATDGTIQTSQLVSIERMVNHLPVFSDYKIERLKEVSNTVFDLLAEEDGLDILWETMRTNLPERLFDTAYAMACDVAAADGEAHEAELEFLAEMRYELNIDRLLAAAIEAGARARHRRL